MQSTTEGAAQGNATAAHSQVGLWKRRMQTGNDELCTQKLVRSTNSHQDDQHPYRYHQYPIGIYQYPYREDQYP